eukprot:TRINITY_DN35210_c0_g1_i1.p1 TRINITY_DN35210_c0_g1~~TRINITY_DN35210_c0_g1_i1.p1  ORF type:complete len:607 (-),score=92.49 TRINITY_DN35210_c0_g1_i1:244-2064(-)
MDGSWNPFIDPKNLPLPQLGFLCAVYGYTLFQASNLISDGSELLLFIPALEGIIGSVILPVLGVVPDSMMVLFSGLGDRKTVQHQVSVGVGTLAGSTIMLLTLPWAIAIFAGRVTILKDGTPNYKRPKGASNTEWQALMPPGNMHLTQTGIRCGTELRVNAMLMVVTMSSYFIIQIPAEYDDKPSLSYDQQGRAENKYAGIAFLTSGIWFIIYLIQQYWESSKEGSQSISREKEIRDIVELIHEGKFSLLDTMTQFRQEAEDEAGRGISRLWTAGDASLNSAKLNEALLGEDAKLPMRSIARVKQILKSFFQKYDKDHNGMICKAEFYLICQDMGLSQNTDLQDKLFEDADLDSNGNISLEEFQSCIVDCARVRNMDSPTWGPQPKLPNQKSISEVHSMMLHHGALTESEDEEDGKGEAEEESEGPSEEDEPEGLEDLDPETRRFWILFRSFRMMFLGTVIVLAFSSPMVDVMAEIGDRLEVSPFYISFVIAPIASNAGELVAAYNYALKRTERTITVSISTLQGAACMNNTLCLCIFTGLIYLRDLPWQFSAECLSILVVELILAIFSYFKRTQTLFDALWIASLYPASLVFVWALKQPTLGGLD